MCWTMIWNNSLACITEILISYKLINVFIVIWIQVMIISYRVASFTNMYISDLDENMDVNKANGCV